MYLFTGESIRSLSMTPGPPELLRVESGTRLPVGFSQPRVVQLDDGRFRLFASGPDGIHSAISDDGLSFAVEEGVRVSAASVGATALSGPSNLVQTADGRWRMYFSELPAPSAGDVPLTTHTIYSASSTDLENWVVDEGTRIGTGAALTGSGEHPAAIVNADGSISIFYFRNDTKRLMVATSDDGLSFTTEADTRLSTNTLMAKDPDVVRDGDGTVRLIYNHGTDAGGWIYSAYHPGNLPWWVFDLVAALQPHRCSVPDGRHNPHPRDLLAVSALRRSSITGALVDSLRDMCRVPGGKQREAWLACATAVPGPWAQAPALHISRTSSANTAAYGESSTGSARYRATRC